MSHSALASAIFAAAQAGAPSPEYLEVVERYRQGDRATLRQAWSEERLRRELAALKRMPEGQADAFPFAAAAMWLTDRDVEERTARGKHVEEVASEPAPLLEIARETIELIPELERRQRFERAWFLAISLHLFQRGQWPLAQRHVDAALRLYPEDAELLLARGSILEAFTIAQQDLVAPGDVTTRARREAASQAILMRSQRLSEAADSYRRALVADPQLHEARARLGRVLARLGRREQATRELEVVIGEPRAAASARYLAQLFLGSVRESEGKPREAQRAYEAAIAVAPQSQAAYVALSHARHSAGERAASVAPLRQAIALAGSRRERDPWWTYTWGQALESETLLEALRRSAVR